MMVIGNDQQRKNGDLMMGQLRDDLFSRCSGRWRDVMHGNNQSLPIRCCGNGKYRGQRCCCGAGHTEFLISTEKQTSLIPLPLRLPLLLLSVCYINVSGHRLCFQENSPPLNHFTVIDASLGEQKKRKLKPGKAIFVRPCLEFLEIPSP